jgi:hypothetical protein
VRRSLRTCTSEERDAEFSTRISVKIWKTLASLEYLHMSICM